MENLSQTIKDSDFESMERMDRWELVHKYLIEIGSELEENNKRISRLNDEIEYIRLNNEGLRKAVHSLSERAKVEFIREKSLTLNDMHPDDIVIDRPPVEEDSNVGNRQGTNTLLPASANYSESDLANQLKKLPGIGDIKAQTIAANIFQSSDEGAVQGFVQSLLDITKALPSKEDSGQMSMSDVASREQEAGDLHD